MSRSSSLTRTLTDRGRRYNEILFMVDTCQANTLYSKLYSPNIIATGSSAKDENSFSVRNVLWLVLGDRLTIVR